MSDLVSMTLEGRRVLLSCLLLSREKVAPTMTGGEGEIIMPTAQTLHEKLDYLVRVTGRSGRALKLSLIATSGLHS